MQGKVGAAFAGFHQSLGEALVVSNEFSQAQFTNSRAISAVIAKVGALQGPLKTTTDTNGKLSVSTASWVDALNNVGLNALKTRAAFAGPDGLINGLQYLKTTADGSLPKLEQYLTAIGGSAGVGPLTLLINHLGQAKTLIDQTGKASGQGLNTAFNLSQKDIDNQMEELKNKAENVLRGVGMFLLPDVKDLANWTDDTFKYFQAHPLVSKIASDSAIGLFGAAVAYKIGKGLVSAVQGIKSLFGGSALTLNTTATQDNTDALLGKTGVTGAEDATVGVSAIAGVVIPLALAAAVAYIAKGPITNSVNNTSHKLFGTDNNSAQLQATYDAAIKKAGGNKSEIELLNTKFATIEKDFGFLITELGPGAHNKKPKGEDTDQTHRQRKVH